jgi:hypothetical protein
MALRLEVFQESAPDERKLVSLKEDATLDDLHKAIELRLGVVAPQKLCLGESQAEVVSVADIRDGDSIRVVSSSPKAAGADDADDERVSPWRPLIKLFLTLFIFVLLELVFQRLVYLPLFHEEMEDDGEASKWVEGSRHYVDDKR